MCGITALCCITLSPHCLTELVTPLWPSQAWRAAGQNTPVSSQLSSSYQQVTLGTAGTYLLKTSTTAGLTDFQSNRPGVVLLSGGDDLEDVWLEDVSLAAGCVRGLSWLGAR